jgi:hypothetical protein
MFGPNFTINQDNYVPPPHTQASDLPSETDQVYMSVLETSKIEILTRSDTDIEDWFVSVEDVLRQLQMYDLLDINIPRPNETDEDYQKWAFWTNAVGWWLRRFLNAEMESHLSGALGDITYTDDLFHMIKTYFGRADCSSHLRQEMSTWNNMRRADYESAEDFVIACENSCIILDRFSVGPPRFMALSRLLDELSAELPKVAAIEWELRLIPPDSITDEAFGEYCKQLIEAAREMSSGRQ